MSQSHNAQDGSISGLLGTFWTFANVLSLIRLVLVVPITYLVLVDGSLPVLFSLCLLAIITDFFDGRIARWSDTVSSWGKVLDPLADKAAAGMVTLALVIRGSLPVWFVALIVVRDVVIFLGGVILARRTARVPASMWWGKVAVTVLAITVLAALLKADQPVLDLFILATSGLLVFSFVLYLIRFVRLYRYGRLPRLEERNGAESAQIETEQEVGSAN